MARAAGVTAAILAASALLAAPAATASSASPAGPPATVYNNIPNPLPGNVPSVGYEATATSEFGGQVGFDFTNRAKPQLTIVMSSWACQTGTWNNGDCHSAKKAKFKLPLKVRVYEVGEDGAPGAILGSVTHAFKMPYRPSANYTHCSGDDAGKWYDPSTLTCYNGKAFTVTVKLGSLDLPDTAIVSVAYNTTHYGASPFGESAPCFTSDGGCFYDGLNVGTGDSPASVGFQPLPDDAYLNSSQGFAYCDGGTGGTDTFRLDAGCWTGFQPAFEVKAK